MLYDGDWKHGQKHGKGELKYMLLYFFITINRIVIPKEYLDVKYKSYYELYQGELKNDKFYGQGKYQYADGSVYEGEWMNNLKKGKGKLTYPSK